jgi:hypothetical protein
MLSEKYKSDKINYFKAVYIGLISNFITVFNREKCSSLLLLFAFIFSVTDFYLHKELGLLFFFIVSTIGYKFKFHLSIEVNKQKNSFVFF